MTWNFPTFSLKEIAGFSETSVHLHQAQKTVLFILSTVRTEPQISLSATSSELVLGALLPVNNVFGCREVNAVLQGSSHRLM